MKLLVFLSLILTPAYISAQSRCLTLAWADEFDSTGQLNSDNWSPRIGDGCPDICGYGNSELQYYTDHTNNVRVEDGNLVIEAHKEQMGSRNYTSARITSKYKKDSKYGRVEVRAKLPSGVGTWPAIWMMPTNKEYGGWPNSGEIDIMEHVGFNPNIVHATVHTGAYNHTKGTQKGGTITVTDAESAFHVYAIEWYEDSIQFFIDDTNYFTFHNEYKTSAEWPFDKEFFLIMNIAVGGTWGGQQGVDDAIFPQQMLIDYVRVYELTIPAITGNKYPDVDQSNVDYSTNLIDGANYEWSVSGNAEIIGSTTSQETILNWKSNVDTLTVELSGSIDCNTDHVSLIVKPVITPDEGSYQISAFEDLNDFSQWSSVPGKDNIIDLSTINGELKVDYDVNRIYAIPYLISSFKQPLNVVSHQKLLFDITSASENAGLELKFYLVDAEGIRTKSSLSPNIIHDGKSHSYVLDFTEEWSSSEVGVDSTIIESIEVSISKGSGMFSLDNVAFADESVVAALNDINHPHVSAYPNPSSGEFWIDLGTTIPKKSIQLKILNTLGEYVEVESHRIEGDKIYIKSNQLSKGIYLVLLITKDKTHSIKILVE